MYWRERLEHIMTGVTVNTLVLLLVSVDLVNLIVVVILDSLASCNGMQGLGLSQDSELIITCASCNGMQGLGFRVQGL